MSYTYASCGSFDFTVSYSVDGGNVWVVLSRHSSSSVGATPVYITLPDAAKTSATRVRVYQPGQSGTWAIDTFVVAGGCYTATCSENNTVRSRNVCVCVCVSVCVCVCVCVCVGGWFSQRFVDQEP